MQTLVIDTSFGSTVGFVGHDPVLEDDSRGHVENLQVDIDRAAQASAIAPSDITRIVVGIGPAPFTGLRAGLVAAKAIAAASGAELLGEDILTPQAAMMKAAHAGDERLAGVDFLADVPVARDGDNVHYVTLAVNDARRKQLYFTLIADLYEQEGSDTILVDMDIDYPDNIAVRVNKAVADYMQAHPGLDVVVDVAGHGAGKYADAWKALDHPGSVVDHSLLDCGRAGLGMFAAVAERDPDAHMQPESLEPLYLRRPDVSVPKPLKPVTAPASSDNGQAR
ncbi:tRNA (adenosine(37)-N6)-threonylcarbamoyltransferase complex dimerization subunit type 1 TsaB [Bifidobacterium choloepi]|uniref:tRNA (Adenosine(37)-N6)-threonylcarbamoyltransferase complex dimerization subunit type 1 TsaB n=1 Tax=Bifidobacterium choloepi TaxID=2614131 RepID=A0A6I5N990_9BIFI|nr:tRNA (adenosine(37)-N6)-threonylcarbamoyltransferase complex dimerization subunit type 1 TsaB [Bifidobacterium choloepi]NEG69050.1 tRNA (adenosine(37)-N6)-threonylcarbamoyltransferase complex dimerization subunit type 1 TsaB [Bifidobacterium choloepi]